METRLYEGRTVLISSLTKRILVGYGKISNIPDGNKLVKPFELILNILVIPNDK